MVGKDEVMLGGMSVVEVEIPSLTAKIRRILGATLLYNFDTSISNVVEKRNLYVGVGVEQAGRKEVPFIRERE